VWREKRQEVHSESSSFAFGWAGWLAGCWPENEPNLKQPESSSGSQHGLRVGYVDMLFLSILLRRGWAGIQLEVPKIKDETKRRRKEEWMEEWNGRGICINSRLRPEPLSETETGARQRKPAFVL
jgi:hypothetical protein